MASASAHVVLPVHVDAPSPYDSYAPALALLEMLMAAVFEADPASAQARMAAFEQTSQDAGLL